MNGFWVTVVVDERPEVILASKAAWDPLGHPDRLHEGHTSAPGVKQGERQSPNEKRLFDEVKNKNGLNFTLRYSTCQRQQATYVGMGCDSDFDAVAVRICGVKIRSRRKNAHLGLIGQQ